MPNITESFQDPILIRLYNQLRNTKQKFNLKDFFGSHLQLDKVTPSMRETFKMPADEAKMKKAVNSIIVRGGADGFFATEDFDGNFINFYNSNGVCYDLRPDEKNYYVKRGSALSVSDIRSNLSTSSRAMINIKYVHVWKPADVRNGQIQQDRREAQRGIVTNDPDYLRNLLYVQRNRYKAAVAKIKATRKSDAYINKVKEVDKIMERFSKFMNKLIADTSWASSIGYKATSVFDSIRQGYVRDSKFQRYGVVYAFQQWSYNVTKTLAGDADTWTKIDSSELDKAIAWAEGHSMGRQGAFGCRMLTMKSLSNFCESILDTDFDIKEEDINIGNTYTIRAQAGLVIMGSDERFLKKDFDKFVTIPRDYPDPTPYAEAF